MPSHAVAQGIPPEAKQLGSPHHIAPVRMRACRMRVSSSSSFPLAASNCGLRDTWDRRSRGTW